MASGSSATEEANSDENSEGLLSDDGWADDYWADDGWADGMDLLSQWANHGSDSEETNSGENSEGLVLLNPEQAVTQADINAMIDDWQLHGIVPSPSESDQEAEESESESLLPSEYSDHSTNSDEVEAALHALAQAALAHARPARTQC